MPRRDSTLHYLPAISCLPGPLPFFHVLWHYSYFNRNRPISLGVSFDLDSVFPESAEARTLDAPGDLLLGCLDKVRGPNYIGAPHSGVLLARFDDLPQCPLSDKDGHSCDGIFESSPDPFIPLHGFQVFSVLRDDIFREPARGILSHHVASALVGLASRTGTGDSVLASTTSALQEVPISECL